MVGLPEKMAALRAETVRQQAILAERFDSTDGADIETEHRAYRILESN